MGQGTKVYLKLCHSVGLFTNQDAVQDSLMICWAVYLEQGWAIILPQGPNEKPTLLPRANQHFVTRYQKDKTRCHSTNSRCRLVNFKHHVCQLWQERTHAHVISSQYVSISVFEWVFIHYLVINWPHKWNIADLLRATQNHQEGPQALGWPPLL